MFPLGPNLQAWRNRLGLSQTELARRAGISRPNLVAIEQGRKDLTLSTLVKISQALGISPGKLLEETPPRFKLDRHQVDRVAKAVLGHTIPAHPQEINLAYAAVRLLSRFLSAMGKEPKSILKNLRPRTGKFLPPSETELEPILRRVRHLAAGLRGGSHV
jgi:transcriptional regulator with XRE-family HTH domain